MLHIKNIGNNGVTSNDGVVNLLKEEGVKAVVLFFGRSNCAVTKVKRFLGN